MARKTPHSRPAARKSTPAAEPPKPLQMPEPLSRPDRRMALDALAVFGLMLFVRLLYVAWARTSDPFFGWARPGWDMAHFQNMADMFVSGDWILRKQGLFYYSPVFGWFCGIVYSIFGSRNFLAVHIVQAIIAAWSVGLAFILARTWLGRAGAWFAALALGLSTPWLFYEQTLLHEGMMFFLYTVFLWGVRTGSLGWRFEWTRFLIAGVAIGVAALGRGNALAVLIVMSAWILYSALSTQSSTLLKKLAPAAILVLGTVLVLGALVVRNHAVSGKWTVGMDNGKVLFYLGNAIDADGTFSYSPRFLHAHEKDPQHDYIGHFFEDLAQSPSHFVGLLARKTFYFFRTQDLADNMNLHLAEKLVLPLKFTPVRWWWLMPLGLVGLALTVRRRDWLPIWLFTGAFAVSLILIIPIGRYRAPVLLPISIAAGFAVQWAVAYWKAGRREPVAGAGLGVVLLGLVLAPWPSAHAFIRSNDYGAAILAAIDSGMADRAVEICDMGLIDYPSTTPEHGVLLNRKLQALVAAGRAGSGEALEISERLLQARAFFMDSAISAAEVYTAHGQRDKARELAASLLQTPKLPEKDRKKLETYLKQ